MGQNVLANAPKVFVDIGIGVSQDGQAKTLQILIPNAIGLLSWGVIVLRAVQLDDQLSFSNVKIHNIWADDFLAVDHNGETF